MIASLLRQLSSLSRAALCRRRAAVTRRFRLGFYGFRYRKTRNSASIVARCAIAAILLFATIAAANDQFSR